MWPSPRVRVSSHADISETTDENILRRVLWNWVIHDHTQNLDLAQQKHLPCSIDPKWTPFLDMNDSRQVLLSFLSEFYNLWRLHVRRAWTQLNNHTLYIYRAPLVIAIINHALFYERIWIFALQNQVLHWLNFACVISLTDMENFLQIGSWIKNCIDNGVQLFIRFLLDSVVQKCDSWMTVCIQDQYNCLKVSQAPCQQTVRKWTESTCSLGPLRS